MSLFGDELQSEQLEIERFANMFHLAFRVKKKDPGNEVPKTLYTFESENCP